MGVKVAKFGGSSLADGSQFNKVKSIIGLDADRRFIVPSAPGKRTYKDQKITDMLYECQKKAKAGMQFSEIFDSIVERYVDIAFELSLSIDFLPHFETARERIQSGASADYAASRGEYINGLLMASFLGCEFIDAAEIIFFDESGAFDADKTQEIASERLAKVKNAVVPGFYGALPGGEIKTFSRGGSDITGAIVARAVYADVYENWTDVSGFLMADPRIVSNPKTIERVTYRELRELAYMGATVLHEASIFPVRQASIPIHVKNTNEPEAPGTVIVPDKEAGDNERLVTGVAGKKGFTVIALEKDNMNAEIGFARKVLGAIEELGISIEHMPTGIDTLCVVVSDAQLNGREKEVVDAIIEKSCPDSVEVYANMALIATVGRGMAKRVGTSARLFSALSKQKVNIRMIDQGSSEMNIIIGIENDDFNAAVNAIYKEFA